MAGIMKLKLKTRLKKIFGYMPWAIKDRVLFYRNFGRLPNLKLPKTFNEKVLYRKRHACISDEKYSVFADKYLVREFVSKKIGANYLIPLLGKFDCVEELEKRISNYSRFVLKPNHGAGMVKIIDCINNQSELNAIIQTASEWLLVDFAKLTGEAHYAKIKRNILLEKRIGADGEFLIDYKIHLFRKINNDFSYVLQIIDDRFVGDLNRTFYINTLDNIYSGNHQLDSRFKEKIYQAIELSKLLIDDLEYARIDWYIVDGIIYFGEITLTPGAGLGKGYGSELDLLMGQQWDLSLAPR
ncbi:hypothetical protein EXU18_13260 [Klebsiella pneumoniae]|uniref:Uncharacterized protein n=2 Tax=Klebsiella TaxID=570 RepID=A0A0P0YTN5_9ENTR|nr:hypothetical protein EXT87_23840 [Klebsiella pneumoniae]TBO84703.1 hypothetical protein EXT98_04405 [Klebsiella pneumoniae]TBP53342.1 hypothetical protein EXU18_13260 [Klebsiella pneumoniae]BAT24456.1 hypothetical protein [Klebsiella sp. 3454-70]